MKLNTSGNVLFIILIAIALFAALSYTVVQSGRTNVQMMTQQQAKIHVDEILAYAAQVQNTITRLKTMKGCSDGQISFKHANYFTGYTNTNSPSDKHCYVFAAEGGKLAFLAPPKGARVAEKLANTSHFNRDFVYVFGNNNGVKDLGSSDTDIMMIVTFLKDEVCDEINKRHNITKYTRVGVDFSDYTYDLTLQETFGDTANDIDLKGKEFGCVQETGSSTAGKHFYYVLARR